MGVNDFLTLIRFFLMVVSCFTFLVVYRKLKFKGFLTLVLGTVFSAIALTFVKFKVLESNELFYELLLLCVVLMWILSAYLILRALNDYKFPRAKRDDGGDYSQRSFREGKPKG